MNRLLRQRRAGEARSAASAGNISRREGIAVTGAVDFADMMPPMAGKVAGPGHFHSVAIDTRASIFRRDPGTPKATL